MKKKFVALLISAVMAAGSLAVPVYAEEEGTVVEFTDDAEGFSDIGEEIEVLGGSEESDEGFADESGIATFSEESEAVNARTVIGGNIDWGKSDSVLPTDVTAARTGRMFLGIKGSYITDAQKALDRINEIRKEACEEGVKDPRNQSRNLTPSDYVPIKWSSDLEYIARIRAAEASVYLSHTRTNGNSAFSISSPNGIKGNGEVLAWSWSNSLLFGIEQWYEEKADWVENTGNVTGHYTQMIDPGHTYVGLATFINPDGVFSTTTAGEYCSKKDLDESTGPAVSNCIQTVEVKKEMIEAKMQKFLNAFAAWDSFKVNFKLLVCDCEMDPLDSVTWTSSNPKAATIDQNGVIKGVHEGATDITVVCGDYTNTETLQVVGHPNTELKNAKEATCSEEGYTGDEICKDCGETAEVGKTIEKKAHSWDNGKVTKTASCTEKGEKVYTCQVCETTKTEEISAAGHKKVTDAGVAAGCETTGKTEGSHCSVCGTVLAPQETIKALGHCWDKGKITKAAACEEKGVKTYTCKTCKTTKTEKIPAAGHKFTSWKTASKATVFAPEKQTRTCTVCGEKEQRNKGSKLKATMKVNLSSIPLKTKQKTTVLKVTGLAKGDSVSSWVSDNKKVAAVTGKSNGTCTITAGSKTGKATITITLKSGLKKKVTVTVQKSTVKTSKISGVAKTLKMRKSQKITLKPSLQPLTSTEKITYKSSNSKVASVSTKGKITAKKKGTAVITVTSGTKIVKCTVTVK